MTAVAWFPLDETSGLVANDVSGNGNHGAVTGGEWVDSQINGAIEFNAEGNISVPASAFDTVDKEVTIAFWAYGGDTQPNNNSVFYGVNASNDRVLNVHLPFGNGAVFWDAGGDRINKSVDRSVYKDSWQHWAFTKNASTGSMDIYLNGQPWASGTEKTGSMAGITSFTLGSVTDGSLGYDGRLDDVRIYDNQLTASEVLDLYTSTAPPNTEETLATNSTLIANTGTSTVVTSAFLQTTDTEQSASDLIYTLTSIPESGTVVRDGNALEVFDTFTQNDIDNNLVAYDFSGSGMSDSFSFDVNDGYGSFISDTFTISLPAGTANSFDELRAFASLSNVTVTMAPGVYWVNGDRTGATYLNFSGSDSTFDLSHAEFKLDTRDIANYRDPVTGARGEFDVMLISGSNLTVNGLNLQGLDVDLDTDPDAGRNPSRAANFLRISGDGVNLNDAHIITAGSNPYGFGDAFGKGSPPAGRGLPPEEGGVPYVGHNKVSGILLNGWGSNAKIDGLDLDMFTFGHGVYIQGFDDIEIRNSSVTGVLFSSNDVIAHPAYQEYGINVYGQVMPADILISGSEDGIRYYGDGDSLAFSEGLIIENVEVTNMREAFSLIAARGEVTVDNARAYGNEVGFEPGRGTVITNSEGDATNGPLLFYRQTYVDNTNVEIKLVGNEAQVGRTSDIAYIAGENNVVTLTSDIDPDLLPDDAYVRVGQRFNDWRRRIGSLDDTSLDADGIVLNNLTGQITVLGRNAEDVSGFSTAGTINGGDGNHYDGETLVLRRTRMIASDSQALGNDGSTANGTLESNGTIVYDGGTLELDPGVRISNEMLTITGDGIDGEGALYTDGQTGNGTRFGSSSNSDESTIVLAGDASIGVGVAGNQLLVGSIQGSGDLTKLGPGTLSIEKSSSLDGGLIIAEGDVVGRNGVVNDDLTVSAGASIKAIGNTFSSPDGVIRNEGTVDLNARSGEGFTNATIGTLVGDGRITSSNATAGSGGNLNIVGDSGDGDYSGSIDGLINVVKSGQNSQTFGGTLTHTGTTTVNDGTLLVDGTHTGGGNYTVGSGGTLGGDGFISSSVIVNSGGRLAPGANAGSLSVGAVALSSGAFFEAEIGGTNAGSQYDQLIAAGSAVLGGSLNVSLLGSNGETFEPSSSQTFTILSAGSLSGSFDNVAGGERVETLGGEGSFLVTLVGSTVLLSDFEGSQLDYGDAPDTFAGAGYPTLLADDGARHEPIGPYLGSSRDVESDGAPSLGADGDGSDEDGVLFGGIGVDSEVAAVNIALDSGVEGLVDAWIDFNRDGVWDSSEKIIDSVLYSETMQTINYNLPSGLTTGDTYARVRISSTGGLGPAGYAADGEVEDYLVNIVEPPTVESIVINDGEDQRSSVDSVQVTFDQVVDIDNTGGSAFSFVHESGDVVTAVPVITESNEKTVVNFTFDSGGLRVTNFGSLEDGDYELVIDASRVTAAGVELDGNRDGQTGDSYVMAAVDGLFRKYGDQTGDDGVGLGDFAAFRSSFGRSHGDDGYLHGLDSDGNETIGLTDFAAFRSNFGT